MVRFVGVRENACGFGMARLCCDISATVRIYTEHKTHRSVLSVVLTVVGISFSLKICSCIERKMEGKSINLSIHGKEKQQNSMKRV